MGGMRKVLVKEKGIVELVHDGRSALSWADARLVDLYHRLLEKHHGDNCLSSTHLGQVKKLGKL